MQKFQHILILKGVKEFRVHVLMNLPVDFLVPVFSAAIDKLPSAVTETGPLLPKKWTDKLWNAE